MDTINIHCTLSTSFISRSLASSVPRTKVNQKFSDPHPKPTLPPTPPPLEVQDLTIGGPLWALAKWMWLFGTLPPRCLQLLKNSISNYERLVSLMVGSNDCGRGRGTLPQDVNHTFVTARA